jgi:hypothetical protein
MTVEELVAEGRRLARRTLLLLEIGSGTPAAVWYGPGKPDTDDGHRCWLSVDAQQVPSFDGKGWLSVFTNEKTCTGGRVETGDKPWKANGVKLYAHEIPVLPPLDAVTLFGSPAVEEWLKNHRWRREAPLSRNFKGWAVAEGYERAMQKEHPLYDGEAYATLGGWHLPWPDEAWSDLVNTRLVVQTYKDSEPWVEVLRMENGILRVSQRIT